MDDYQLHQQSEAEIAVEPERLFAWLDDPRRLASHMERPSLTTAGSSMRFETDAGLGQAIGSHIRMSGSVLGIHLALDEIVTHREPPFCKTWETVGEPQLLVIGAYRMGFVISPTPSGPRRVVFIDYRLPEHGFARGLGLLLGRAYAGWCTRRMARDAQQTASPASKQTRST
ncbi:MAG: SRPBCC family protein [Burkholderiales bacterium]|nr:SRPBCC family protein [Burkholderiales bacterium]